MLVGVILVELGVGGLNRESAALGHGIARVHDQVRDHLLHLPRVGLHGAQVGCERGAQLDVLPDQASQQFFQVHHQRVQVEYLRRQDLLPAESEQLPRQVGGAFRRFADFLDVVALLLLRHRFQQEFGRAEDCGQEVVEVVRDAAR